MPARADNSREVSAEQTENAARYVVGAETVIDSTAHLRIEEEIEVAYPRLAYEIRKTAKPGYVALPIARIVEVHDRTLVFDEKFAPPVLVCAAHPTVEGWLDRVIGWIGNKLDELARYASDPDRRRRPAERRLSDAAMLNREIPVLKHFRSSHYVHPERLYEKLLRIAGELATFATPERRAREYGAYDHDDLESVFAPLLRDIQDFLSARLDRRAIRLELIERAPNALCVDHQRPHAVPQRDLRARSLGAPPADRDPAQPARLPQGRAEHQDERDRARAPAGRSAGASADAAAADPRHHRPRLFLPRPHLAAVARVQSAQRSACISPATGRSFRWSSGRSGKIGDERRRRSVRPQRPDDHPSQSRRAPRRRRRPRRPSRRRLAGRRGARRPSTPTPPVAYPAPPPAAPLERASAQPRGSAAGTTG